MSSPEVVTHGTPLRVKIAQWRRSGKTIGVVPTMGALHDGHMSLVDASRRDCDATVATIFVNPLQFGSDEDLKTYPRTFDADCRLLEQRGVDLVFAPPDEEIYRPGHETYIELGETARPMEGLFRPGHFRGVATVVIKLLHLIPADIAYFGRKDYQQALVVQRVVRDLDLPVEIRCCPIVRDPDGLAISSRNVRLSPDERERALSLSQALDLAEAMVAAGQRNAHEIQRAVQDHIVKAGKVRPQYVALVRDGSVEPVRRVEGPTVLALAAVFGKTRLIDNCVLR